MLVHAPVRHSREYNFDTSVAQITEQRSGVPLHNLKTHERMLTGKPINHASQQACGERLRAPDSYLSHSGIQQEFDLFDALFQFIEYRQAWFDDCPSVARRFHSP